MSNWPLLRVGGPARTVTFTNADATTVTPTRPTVAHQLGAWTQLTASTPFAAEGFFVSTATTNDDTERTYALAFAIGPVGQEVIIAHDLYMRHETGYRSQRGAFYVPVRVPAGVRMAVAFQASNVSWPNTGSNSALLLTVNLFQASPLFPIGFAGYDAINYQRASTSLGPASVPGAYGGGSIVQLVGSTARAYRGIMVAESAGGGVLDLYVGASGEETPLFEKHFNTSGFNANTVGGFTHPVLPVRIPAGSRLSMRQWGGGPGSPLLYAFY